jgi:4'-phosphopantetheinyl transferase EntD
MGIILKKDLSEGCRLGIWEITEDYDDLRKRLSLESEEAQKLEGFKSMNRKIEWLSVRTLANDLTGMNTRIIYNESRKPFLLDNSYNISISHSNKLTSILIGRYMRVGIDTEFMSHRISRIADRFIHEEEVITEDPDLVKYHLYIHWCAKEALYKICDKQYINFRKNLKIDPFIPADQGEIRGTVDNIKGKETFLLSYMRMDDYIIVWCYK